ncbi:SCO family protein [Saccharobesus litoralis]|uniref:SCO family protein n=1 Tax=Saccharobesus litoralis TaxID=2172099 RepID=UPI00131F0C84|nr:SCO family protein [Saccharobesus litoralis]
MNNKPIPEDTLSNVRIYQPERNLSPFQLVDHTGKVFTNAELQNKWSFVFLGYTYCPDICPTTMQGLASVYAHLQAVDQNVQVVMISADPQRDSVEVLGQYVPFFHPQFVGVTAEHKYLLPFTRELGLVYSMTEGTSQDNYLVNHSASIVLINPQGKIAALVKPDFSLTPPVVDYAKLVNLLEIVKA